MFNKVKVAQYAAAQPIQAPYVSNAPIDPIGGEPVSNFYTITPFGLALLYSGDLNYLTRAGHFLEVGQPRSVSAIYAKMVADWSTGKNSLDSAYANQIAPLSVVQELMGVIFPASAT